MKKEINMKEIGILFRLIERTVNILRDMNQDCNGTSWYEINQLDNELEQARTILSQIEENKYGNTSS